MELGKHKYIEYKNNIKNITAGLFLAVFLLYYVSSTMFGHSHVVNGTTIRHSHLYGSHHTENPTGGHTERDITLINLLSLGTLKIENNLRVNLPKVSIEYTIAIPSCINLVQKDIIHYKSPRAPPTVLS